MNMFIHTLIIYLVLELQSKEVFAKLVKTDSNEHSFWEDLNHDVPLQDTSVLDYNHDLERDDTSGESGKILFWIVGYVYGKYKISISYFQMLI